MFCFGCAKKNQNIPRMNIEREHWNAERLHSKNATKHPQTKKKETDQFLLSCCERAFAHEFYSKTHGFYDAQPFLWLFDRNNKDHFRNDSNLF